MQLITLAKVFHELAEDAKAAADQNDFERYKCLTRLVVALEKAYPDEMRTLREEEVL